MKKPKPEDVMSAEKWLFTFSGFYPYEQRPWYLYICASIHYSFSVLLLFTFFMKIILAENLTSVTDAIQITITHGGFVIKLTNFLHKSKYLLRNECIMKSELFNSHTKDQYHFVQNVIDNTRRFSGGYRVLCVLTITAIVLSPHPKYEELPLPGWFGFDPHQYFGWIYAFQSIAIAMSAYNNSTLDLLNTKLISMGTSQLDVLMCKLKKSVPKEYEDGQNDKALNLIAEQRLKSCVQHHLLIIEYIQNIESIYSYGNLVQFLGSVAVICITGFNSLMVPIQSVKFAYMMIFFITMLAQIGMYCWYGDGLLVKSTNLANACYESGWYHCNVKVRKILLIMMIRMKKPITLSAGSFFTLSLATYMAIIRSSYSYFAVLRRMYNKNNDLNMGI